MVLLGELLRVELHADLRLHVRDQLLRVRELLVAAPVLRLQPLQLHLVQPKKKTINPLSIFANPLRDDPKKTRNPPGKGLFEGGGSPGPPASPASTPRWPRRARSTRQTQKRVKPLSIIFFFSLDETRDPINQD